MSVLANHVHVKGALWVLIWAAPALAIMVTVAEKAKQGQDNKESTSGTAGGKPAETTGRLGPPRPPGRQSSGRDLAGLTEAKIRLLSDSVEAFQELMDASAQVRHATPHPVHFAEATARMRLSLERTRHQLLALRDGVNIGNWPDGEWALTFRDAWQSVESNISALESHAAASEHYVVSDQDGQLGQSVDHLLDVLRERYPSLFAGNLATCNNGIRYAFSRDEERFLVILKCLDVISSMVSQPAQNRRARYLPAPAGPVEVAEYGLVGRPRVTQGIKRSLQGPSVVGPVRFPSRQLRLDTAHLVPTLSSDAEAVVGVRDLPMSS